MIKGSNWTNEEETLLRENYPKFGSAFKISNRSRLAIKGHAKLLGISCDSHRWTDAEDCIIKDKYPNFGSKISILGRTASSIWGRARYLKIKRLNLIWTPEDDKILREEYPKTGTSTLPLILNRSKAAISVHAQILGLKCSNEVKSKLLSIGIGRRENNKIYKGYKCVTNDYISNLRRGAIKRKLDYSLLDGTPESYQYLYSIITKNCPLSGLELSFPEFTEDSSATASLDRIDSFKGYEKGNVQWVHKTLNYMKMDLRNEEFIILCNRVAKINSRNI